MDQRLRSLTRRATVTSAVAALALVGAYVPAQMALQGGVQSATLAALAPGALGDAEDAPATVERPLLIQVAEQPTTILAESAPPTTVRAGALAGSRDFNAGALASLDIPAAALAAYQRAAQVMTAAAPSCHLPWTLLAAIGRVESDHGRFGGSTLDADGVATPAIIGVALDGVGPVAALRDSDGGRLDGDRVWDRAVGPMQFIPSTWAHAGSDGDGDGVRDPQDIDDAALSAAVYLCATGGDLRDAADLESAILAYNPSDEYVALVRSVESEYRTGEFSVPSLALDGVTVTAVPAGPASPGSSVATVRTAVADLARGSGTTRPTEPGKPAKPGKPAAPSGGEPSPSGSPKPGPGVPSQSPSPNVPKPSGSPKPADPSAPSDPSPSTPPVKPSPSSPPSGPSVPSVPSKPTGPPETDGPGKPPASPDPTPDPTPAPTPDPTPASPEPPTPPATRELAGVLATCAGGWCVGDLTVTFGALESSASADHDGDGAVETNALEVEGLAGVEVVLTVTDDVAPTVLGIGGAAY